MDHIDEHLATAATGDLYHLAIKAALTIGKKTLNWYYDKTDHSEVFRIAMGTIYFFSYSTSLLYQFLVLHPRHKLKYFENAGWEDDWIQRAKEIVRTQFELSYGSLDISWADSQQTEAKVCTIFPP